MAGSTTNISIRMDSNLKAQAERLFGELGMNLTTAFNIFVRQSLREGRIPFDISHTSVNMSCSNLPSLPGILPTEINMEDNNAKKRKRHRFRSG